MPEVPSESPVVNEVLAYSSSGTSQVSGIGDFSSFSGAWFVETQTLHVDYHRVPRGTLSSFDLDLDSITVTERHLKTQLIAEVQATYEATKVIGNFQTSSWHQPQKFDVLGFSADALGQSYGDLTSSTLGPVGSIVTSQEFHNRVPWDGQTLVAKEMNAVTYYAKYDGAGTTTTSSLDPIPYNDQYEYWWIPEHAGSLISNFEPFLGTANNLYILPGAYSTGQESNLKLIQLLDTLGHNVTVNAYYAVPTTLTVHGGALRDQGFAEYDRNRHDYS